MTMKLKNFTEKLLEHEVYYDKEEKYEKCH